MLWLHAVASCTLHSVLISDFWHHLHFTCLWTGNYPSIELCALTVFGKVFGTCSSPTTFSAGTCRTGDGWTCLRINKLNIIVFPIGWGKTIYRRSDPFPSQWQMAKLLVWTSWEIDKPLFWHWRLIFSLPSSFSVCYCFPLGTGCFTLTANQLY